jgi:ssDNA-binding replication factor A large subunit
MIKIPYDQIVEKLKQEAKLSDEEINSKIKSKMDQLSGLISKEGAAHIIANELGVKLFEEGKVKIKNILMGMRTVETIGKVTNIYGIKEFQRKDGTPGKIASFIIADETAQIRVVLWNDHADMLKDLKEGAIVKISDAYARQNNNNSVELHFTTKSELIIDPKGESIGETAARQKANRKKIEELSEADSNVEILATVVQVFEPRFYEVCPECNKRIRQKDSAFACDTHGQVTPNFSYVMNLVLDDGSSTIRTVFFRNQLSNLLKMQGEEILKFKESPSDFQSVKDDLLGKIVKVVGRTSKNEMFDRLEFISQLVFSDPSPDEELKRLKEEAKVIE